MALAANGGRLRCSSEQLLQGWVVVVLELRFGHNASRLKQDRTVLILLEEKSLSGSTRKHDAAATVCLDENAHERTIPPTIP